MNFTGSSSGFGNGSAGEWIDANNVDEFIQFTATNVGSFGHGPYQSTGDGGLATAAPLENPGGVATDSHHDLFVADSGDDVVREVSPNGTITTVAGDGTVGYTGDGGPAAAAELNDPIGVAADGQGDLFIADAGNSVIREVTPGPDGLLSDGTITTIAGNGIGGYLGDGGAPTAAELADPTALALDKNGDLFIADSGNNVVREVTPGPDSLLSDGTITTVAGNSGLGGQYGADGGHPTDAALNFPAGIAVDGNGDLFIADSGNNVVREATPGPDGLFSDGTIATVAGSYGLASDDGTSPTDAALSGPSGVAVDAAGDLFIADSGNNIVRKATPGPDGLFSDGTIATIAGSNALGGGYGGDGGPPTDAALNGPSGIALDAAGDLFIADSGNNVVREATPGPDGLFSDGNIKIVAGNAARSGSGAILPAPGGDVAVDGQGDLFVTVPSANIVVEVSPDGVITTIAGGGTDGFSVNGVPAIDAALNDPIGVALDAQGDLFIADSEDNVVREVKPGPDGLLSEGTITTVVGDGTAAYGGDGESPAMAQLDDPTHLAMDAEGDLFIVDWANDAIREVMPGPDGLLADGTIITIAGDGPQGSHDDIVDNTDELGNVTALTVDGEGHLFFAESGSSYPYRALWLMAPGPDGLFADGYSELALDFNLLARTPALALDAEGDLFGDVVTYEIEEVFGAFSLTSDSLADPFDGPGVAPGARPDLPSIRHGTCSRRSGTGSSASAGAGPSSRSPPSPPPRP